MEISPLDILRLLFYAFVFGCACGVINDINRLIRAGVGEDNSKKNKSKLYNKKIPLLGRALKMPDTNNKIIQAILLMITSALDLTLFFVAGAGCAILNFYFNSGRVRIYSVIAILFGFLIYYFTIGKITVRIFKPLIFIIRATFAVLFKLVFTPFYVFGRFLIKNVKKLYQNINKTLAKRVSRVYNNIKKRESLNNVCKSVEQNKK